MEERGESIHLVERETDGKIGVIIEVRQGLLLIHLNDNQSIEEEQPQSSRSSRTFSRLIKCSTLTISNR